MEDLANALKRSVPECERPFGEYFQGLSKPGWDLPLLKLLGELADGGAARNLVVNTANRAIQANTEEVEDIKALRDEFLIDFTTISSDPTIPEQSRTAIFGAISQALFIGIAVGSPELMNRLKKELGNAQAAEMRRARAAKLAPLKDETLEAIRAEIDQTAAKPSRGEAFARIIQPEVQKRVRHPVSVSTIRRYIKTILEE